MSLESRIERARDHLADVGADVLLLSVGADLPYLTGYEAMPLERLTMLVLPVEGEPTLVVPRLEAPRVEDPPAAVRAWDETEDPVRIVADLAGDPAVALVGDTTWAVFLLGLQEALPATTFASASAVMRRLRIRKDADEVARLRTAAGAADRVIERLDGLRFSGRTEAEVARWIGDRLLEEGHDEVSFAIVASGPNGASPHHEPGGRVIAEGDTVVVDIGGRMDGYCSDTTRTFQVGEPAHGVAEAYAVLELAQRAGVEAVAPGVPAADVDRAARRVIDEAGWGDCFVHRTGHGIGMSTHEDPYLVAGNDEPLQPGMACSVEPGIYVPDRFGMRIEDIVVVTDDGVEALNTTAHGLRRVG